MTFTIGSIIFVILFAFIAKKLTHPGRTLSYVMLFFGLILLVNACNKYYDAWQVSHYQQTACTITKQIPGVDVFAQQNQPVILCPQVLINYASGGQTYQQNIKLDCVSSANMQANVLSVYPVGQLRACFVNPNDPTQVLLTKYMDTGFALFELVTGLFLISWITAHLYFPNLFMPVPTPVAIMHTDFAPQPALPQNQTQQNSLVQTNPILTRIIFAIFTLIFAAAGYFLMARQWEVNHKFQTTSCMIHDKSMVRNLGSKGGGTYHPQFRVSYSVGTQSYNEWITADILGGSSSSYRSEALVFDRYNIGSAYPCWYNPQQPTQVVLQRGYEWISLLFILIPVVLLIITVMPWKRVSNPSNEDNSKSSSNG